MTSVTLHRVLAIQSLVSSCHHIFDPLCPLRQPPLCYLHLCLLLVGWLVVVSHPTLERDPLGLVLFRLIYFTQCDSPKVIPVVAGGGTSLVRAAECWAGQEACSLFSVRWLQ